jgi:hypothetical protein
MNHRPLLRIRFGLAQDLPRGRGDVAFTEEDEPRQILQGIAFRPAEIGVRRVAQAIADGQQHGGNRIRHRRAFRAQHAKPADLLCRDAYRRGELGGVADSHLQEDHRIP